MNRNDIDKMLNDMQKTPPEVNSDFSSTEEFKAKFFQKVKEDGKNSPRSKTIMHLTWLLPAAASICVVVYIVFGNMLTQEKHYVPSPQIASENTESMPQPELAVPACAAPSASFAQADHANYVPVRHYAPTKSKSAFRTVLARKSVPRPAKMRMHDNFPAIHKTPRQTFNTEEYKTISENPFLTVENNPLSTFGADVDTASYNLIKQMLQRNVLPPKDAVRIEELVNAFRYNYPAPEKDEKFAVTFESAPAPWNKKHQLLLIGMQAKDCPMEQLPNANYVFLVDNSGSMYDEMPLVIEALTNLISQLRPNDRLSLVTYGGGEQILLDGISADDRQQAIKTVKNLTADGATYGSKGIKTAYQLAHKHFIPNGNNRIVLLTDGDFNVGVSSESELVKMVEKERKSLIYLSTFGFGYGNYKDNKLKMLANKGNGNYTYISSLRDARNAAKKCFTGNMFTLARDVKFQIEFNPLKVKGYRLLGYELRNLADRDFNDDSKDAGEVGVGHQVTVLYELIFSDSDSTALGKVDSLKYQKRANNGSQEILTCKLRYQDPAKHAPSSLRTFALKSYPQAGNNLQWAAAVTEFALLLRDSQHKGNANIQSVLTNAKKAMGSDPDGKRAEFITMLHTAQEILESQTNN